METRASADNREIAQELLKRVEGEVRFDRISRLLYSTDASMYEIEPIGVVLPRTTGDVQAVIEVANKFNAPLLPRGAGTSLAGQTVGRAIILDFSKYMNRVLEVDGESLSCRVEPGLVQDELNGHVISQGLLFGPDTSTANRATIGGMIGNNSAGMHSIAYGKTLDHILELTAYLADGSEIVMKDLSVEEMELKCQSQTSEGRIYRELADVISSHREEILARYPKIMRRVSGYNLDEFVKPQLFNLSRLAVGSEGTLACVVEAKLRLVRKPKFVALDVIHFREVWEALESSPAIVETAPYAVEMLDRQILDLARKNLVQSKRMGFIQGNPDAILIVEYDGETEGEVKAKIEKLESLRKRHGMGYDSVQAFEPVEIQGIWGLRKDGLGFLLGMKGEKKPIAFVEDTAVDPVKLPDFVKGFRDILKSHDVNAGYYGHCSVGCLHIRPFINLKKPGEVLKMTKIASEISDLVLASGGALSGEHGDGLARSHFNEKLFGPDLYQAFRRIKGSFDPKGLMNPGKIVDAPPMTESLRVGPSTETWEPETTLDFSREGGFAAAVEMCSGMGVCRKKLAGTMCPSYMATLEEEHSTRGRANALRAVLSGKLPKEEFAGKRLNEILDLCLECKACKAECPSNVDMAKLKSEVLAHHYKVHGLPLRNRFFGRIETINRWGVRFAPIANRLLNSRIHRWVVERLLGIDRRRPLPMFANQSLTDWFRSRPPVGDGAKGEVVFFHDTFNSFNTPSVAMDAIRILERGGYRGVLPQKECCGRPFISKGMLDEARRNASINVERLVGYADRGVPIIGLEPSCLLTLRDEYPNLLRSEAATKVATRSFLFEEFLLGEREAGRLTFDFQEHNRKALLHGHCHQKALLGTRETVAMLSWAGYDVEEIDAGCCGMAGSFGYEKEHYDLSLTIGNRRLGPAVRSAAPDVEIVASGISCRQQIHQLTDRKARHPVELFWESLSQQNLK